MIKAVLWDIDGTLLDFTSSEKAAIRSCFDIFGLGRCTDGMISDYSDISKRYWHLLETGEMSKPEILVGRFREFFYRYGIDTSIAEDFNSQYQLHLSDTIVFCEGAEEVLSALKGKVIQCAASNGTKTDQVRKLKNSGMDRILDMVFISEDIGFDKPNREFFDAVLQALCPVSPDEIIIVGNSLSSDIKGGHDAGIITCWYDPFLLPNTSGLPIDHVIRGLREVLEIIGVSAGHNYSEQEKRI